MAIAIKLSQEFYERFGNDATNELVAVLNTISLGYRDELREINELNFARFDAKVGERLAELRGELKHDIAELRGELKHDIAELRGELKHDIAELHGELKRDIAELRGELKHDIVELRGELGKEIAGGRIESTGIRAEIDSLRRMLKWMFAFWIPSFLVLVGLLLTRT